MRTPSRISKASPGTLLAACGLEYEPGCLEFHRTQRRVKTASLGQVRQPIYSRSVGRWRNYESELDDLFQAIPTARCSARAMAPGHRRRDGDRAGDARRRTVAPGDLRQSPGKRLERLEARGVIDVSRFRPATSACLASSHRRAGGPRCFRSRQVVSDNVWRTQPRPSSSVVVKTATQCHTEV